MTAILQAYRQAYAGLPRRVWLLAGVMLVSRCGTMFLPFLSIYLTTESGYTPTQAGGVLAVYGVGSVVGTYAGGWLSHRFGPVRVIVVSLLLGAPGFVAIPLCSSLTMLVAALLYLSVVREASRPAINAAMSDFCPPEEHTRAFALNRLALNLGMSVGSGVSGVLATVGYGVMFGFNALVALLAAGLMLAAFGFAAARRGEQDAEATQAAATPWADGVFLAFLALQMLAALVFFQLIGALPMYWRSECGIQEWGIGVLFAVNTLLIVLLEMVVADLLRGVPPLLVVGAGMGLVCLGFGASSLEGVGLLGGGLVLAVVLVPVWTAGEMLSAPFTMTFVASRCAGPGRSLYMGLNAASLSAAMVAAPLIGTRLYEANPHLPWWISLGMAGVLPAAFWGLARHAR